MFKKTIIPLVATVLTGAVFIGSAEAALMRTTSELGGETFHVVVDDVNNLEWLALRHTYGPPVTVISRYSQYGFRWANAEDVNTIIEEIFPACTPGKSTFGCSDYRLNSDNVGSESAGFWKGFSWHFSDLFDTTFPNSGAGSAAYFNDNEIDGNQHLFRIWPSGVNNYGYMKTWIVDRSDDSFGYGGFRVFMVRDFNPQPQTPPASVPEPLSASAILAVGAAVAVGAVKKRAV
ncbi:hypothetical protein [Lyngbya sp. CCY1209]|uniref:hypothetical protein n=1 Tax=Lyngbya sp. CCY1209 TaxID=2886103 RepID=UPI002D205171|nr:hypothetical protein [Lyngbya sp. CCY1209]MEB3884102.1 hypothetical protein [Lyngbya sp. CCY1209]